MGNRLVKFVYGGIIIVDNIVRDMKWGVEDNGIFNTWIANYSIRKKYMLF